MGSAISKANNEAAAQVQKNDSEKDIGGNPDPRSPTPEITRTPLQGKNGAKHNITKNVDLRKTFESGKDEKLIRNNPILSAVIKNHLQSYDPRSPAQDFERTPIILPNDEDKQQTRNIENCGSPCLRNETIEHDLTNQSLNLENLSPELVLPKNLCNGFYDMTLDDTLRDTEEPMGSSTASNDAIENVVKESVNMESSKILLETNFDYVDNGEEITKNILDSPAKEEVKPDIKSMFKILNEDPRSPSNGIDRTPIIVSKINDEEKNVEQMSDDSLIKVLQNTNTDLRQNVEKKDGILIYEDDTTLNDTPKKSKSGSNGSRTPLSCMKNKDGTHTRSKSASDKDVTGKSKRVSHIPRLKSLSKQTKLFQAGSTVTLKNSIPGMLGGDCENTPPQSHRDKWDKESSIVL